MLDQENILDMNILHDRYRNGLVEAGMKKGDILLSYKPHIKDLIMEDVPSAEFVKASRRNMPERIISRKMKEDMVDTTVKQNAFEDLQEIYKVSTMVRKGLLSMKEWRF